MTGGAKTQARASLSPTVQVQPYSWATSLTLAVSCVRCPFPYAATSGTSSSSTPSARATAAGSTRSQNGALLTTSEVVSTSVRGVPSSVATVAAGAAGPEPSPEPVQPTSSSVAATAPTTPRTRRTRRGGREAWGPRYAGGDLHHRADTAPDRVPGTLGATD